MIFGFVNGPLVSSYTCSMRWWWKR